MIALIRKQEAKEDARLSAGRKEPTQLLLHFFVTLTEVLKMAPEASQPCTVILCVPTLKGKKVSMPHPKGKSNSK